MLGARDDVRVVGGVGRVGDAARHVAVTYAGGHVGAGDNGDIREGEVKGGAPVSGDDG